MFNVQFDKVNDDFRISDAGILGFCLSRGNGWLMSKSSYILIIPEQTSDKVKKIINHSSAL